jgi:hypothetical protein
MSTSNPTTGTFAKRRDRSFRDVLMLADDFFMKKGIVFETMSRNYYNRRISR